MKDQKSYAMFWKGILMDIYNYADKVWFYSR